MMGAWIGLMDGQSGWMHRMDGQGGWMDRWIRWIDG